MRTKGIARGLLATFVVSLLLAPLIPAQPAADPGPIEGETKLTYYPTPASAVAQAQKNLFMTVMTIALFVFVFVEALLLYILFRFRRNREVPATEMHRGHTKAEIVWTIIPAVILLFIGVISAQVMEQTDRVPTDVDHVVKVEAFQWAWNFVYPDGTSSSNLYVKEDTKFQLDITSRDVIHAVWIPAVGVKLDAVPGKTNTIWFEATDAGTYALKCAEFCYADPAGINGHHSMTSTVVVCVASDPACKDYGQDAGPVDCRGQATCEVGVIVNAYTRPTVLVDPGQTVTWNWVAGFHTVTGYGDTTWPKEASGLVGPPFTYTTTFAADGTYLYRCEPHSFPQGAGFGGMVGEVRVGTAANSTA